MYDRLGCKFFRTRKGNFNDWHFLSIVILLENFSGADVVIALHKESRGFFIIAFYAPAFEKVIRIFSDGRRRIIIGRRRYSPGENETIVGTFQVKLSHVSDVDNTVADRDGLSLVCFVPMHLFRSSRVLLPEWLNLLIRREFAIILSATPSCVLLASEHHTKIRLILTFTGCGQSFIPFAFLKEFSNIIIFFKFQKIDWKCQNEKKKIK